MNIRLAERLTDRTLAVAYGILFTDWGQNASEQDKAYEMKLIIRGSSKPCRDMQDWSNCVVFLIKEIRAMIPINVFPEIKNWKDVVSNHTLEPQKGRNNAKQISTLLRKYIDEHGPEMVILIPVHEHMDAIFHFVEFKGDDLKNPVYEYMSVVS